MDPEWEPDLCDEYEARDYTDDGEEIEGLCAGCGEEGQLVLTKEHITCVCCGAVFDPSEYDYKEQDT